ncbi:WhiB family transcriptional regulator [Streptomyces violaceorubidus]|uniref:WhiB family transcriptional regulator n=1 Tax=Streptomyces violaceorubidus TaxID=284042 RepID=UPI000998BE03|nr:WhiB family transcriptional regulator [Streptomyces violaceorubidus]
MTAPNWYADAECRREDPDLFDPRGESLQYQTQIEQAKAICRRCPTIDACLAWALVNEGSLGITDRQGVWGGTTPRERWAMSRPAGRSRRA